MKAIYLTKYGTAQEAFKIRDMEVPIPGDHEVLIKVRYSGLNFADVIARKGMYPDAPKNPALLGYDVSGIIEAIGGKVQNLAVGQKVFAMTRFGGYAEYVVTNAVGVGLIPDNISEADSTALATQAITATYCTQICTTLHPGEKVLIQAAAGGVGSLLVQIAKSKGCIVFGTASGGKLDYLKSIGVDHPIDYTRDDFYKTIKKSTDGIDVVFDSIGGTVFKKGYKLLRPGGRIVCFGAAEQMESSKNKLKLISMLWGFGLFSPISLLMQSKSIITVNMLRIADYKPEIMSILMKEIVKMVQDGILRPNNSTIFSYDKIHEAHDFLESRKSIGKVVLEW